MNEPRRWRDDPSGAPEGVLALLDEVPSTPLMPVSVKHRAARRVAQLATASAGALVWVAAKTAAAAGATGFVAVAAITTIVEVVEAPPTAQVVEPTAGELETRRNAPPLPAPKPPRPRHSAVETPDSDAAPKVPAVLLAPKAADALREETRLIEQARMALADSPARALMLVREHAARYPRGQLGAERTIVEIDALRRLGRRTEAEALAERSLARDPNGLYSDRVRRALGSPEDLDPKIP